MKFSLATKLYLLLFVCGILGVFVSPAQAAINPMINYQGKLTDDAGVTVVDGTYNMRFWLLTSDSIATTSAEWDESLTGTDRVQVTNGLFSVMLGSTSPLTSVDFNQTLYLGVEIGGTSGSPAWDGEMSPRKIIGAVPSAFEAENAQTLTGIDATSFLRSDEPDTIASTSATTLLTITQSGTGDILNIFDGVTEVFTITDGGLIGVGSSSPIAELSVGGDFALTGGFYDYNSTRGNNGEILLTTGATVVWTATSSLGLLGSSQLDTCAEFAAIMSGETGTCGALVLSVSPAITGTLDVEASDFSGTMTLSGSAANIALGSNYLSGDGDDEGIYVGGTGLVGIGNAAPEVNMHITGSTGAPATSGTTAFGNLALETTNDNGLYFGSYGVSPFGSWIQTSNRADLSLEYPLVLNPNGGNVGVGTTSPRSGFDVWGTSAAQNTLTVGTVAQGGYLAFGSNSAVTNGIQYGASEFGIYTNQSAGMRFYTNTSSDTATPELTIANDGNVGIGTTSPSQLLHLFGGADDAAIVFSAESSTPEDSGAVTADNATNDNSIGAHPWTNEGNTAASDTSYATLLNFRSLISPSEYLNLQDFDLSVPVDSTITGVVVRVLRYNPNSGTRDVQDNSIRLIKGGVVAGDDNADTGTNWPLSPTTAIYGSDSDLWGLTLTPADVNANDFGVVLSAKTASGLTFTPGVDYVTITVYYTEAPQTNNFVAGMESGVGGSFKISGSANLGTNDYLTITNTGNVGIGTTTPDYLFTVDGAARITGTLYDNLNSAGTNGMVLKSTGTGFAWVATSTLGITGGGGLASADIDTCAEFAAIMSGETGTCGALVLSVSPAITGTLDVEASDFSGTMTLSGSAANIALGSNYLSGDGDDEGIYVGGTGLVGIGTSSPVAALHVGSSRPVTYNWYNTFHTLFTEEKLVPGTDDDHATLLADLTLNSAGATNELNAAMVAGVNIKSGNAQNFGSTMGLMSAASHGGSGTVSSLMGLNGQAINASNGTVTSLVGAIGELYNTGGGTVTSAYGLRVNNVSNSSGTIVNTYGLYIGDVTAGTQTNQAYALYSEDANARNYFGGRVGIATTTPAYSLDVAGFINTNKYSGYKQAGNTILYASSTNLTTLVGQGAGSNLISTPNYSTAVGHLALATATSSTNNTAVGYSALTANRGGIQNVAVGALALLSNTTGNDNVAIGNATLYSNTTGSNNIGNGTSALYSNTTGSDSVAIGQIAAFRNVGSGNIVAIGKSSLFGNTAAANTVAIGMEAAAGAYGTYSNQGGTYIGKGAGYSVQTGSDYNTFVGYLAGNLVTTGANNIIIGAAATGANDNLTTGSQNIKIGYNTSFPSATASGQLNIQNIIYGTGNTGTGGTLSTGKIGIGTTSPTTLLHLEGASGLNGATPVGLTLRSSNNGTWTDESILSQILFSSADTNGTAGARGAIKLYADNTDGADNGLSFWTTTNGLTGLTEAMRISHGGNVSIGTTTSSARLHINGGNLRMDNSAQSAVTSYFQFESVHSDGRQRLMHYSDSTSGKIFEARHGNIVFGPATSAASPAGSTGNIVTTSGFTVLSQVVIGSAGINSGTHKSLIISTPETGPTNFSGSTGIVDFRTASFAANSQSGTRPGMRYSALTHDFRVSDTSGSVPSASSLYIATSGNVGIGTTTPTQRLSVASSSSPRAFFYDSTNKRGASFGVSDGFNAVVDSFVGATILKANGATFLTMGSGQSYFEGGNVGIGDTTPAALLTVGTGDLFQVNSSGAIAASVGITTTGNITLSGSAANIVLGSNYLSGDGGDEGIYVNSTGRVGIGTTGGSFQLEVEGDSAGSMTKFTNVNTSDSDGISIQINDATLTTANAWVQLLDSGGGADGLIRSNGAGGTEYLASSDRRVKDNIIDTQYGLDDLLKIRTVDYTGIGATITKTGFIAQELYEVYPVAVGPNGDDGISPLAPGANPWGIDYSQLTPLLVKGVQDIATIIDLSRASTTVAALSIDEDGNIGIGTTTPSHHLHVDGDIAAHSFINVSTEDAKKNIGYLSEETQDEYLDILSKLPLATYLYKSEAKNAPLRLGLIAEDAPEEILSKDGKGVDLYKFVTFLAGSLKSLAAEVKMFAQIITSDKVVAKKDLCVGETCITEAELQELLDHKASGNNSEFDPEPEEDPSVDETPAGSEDSSNTPEDTSSSTLQVDTDESSNDTGNEETSSPNGEVDTSDDEETIEADPDIGDEDTALDEPPEAVSSI